MEKEKLKNVLSIEEQYNEYWVDDLLELPENHQIQKDGKVLYGYDEEPKFLSQGYFLNLKNALVGVWQAKNPFNENRKVMKACLPLVHPDAYKLFFPFSYLWGLIENIIDPPGTREEAWADFLESAFGEILLLCIFGFGFTGIAILFLKLTGKA